MIKIFGIRHHGPGSAKRLSKALRAFQPDCILIELPEEAEKVLKQADDPDLRPPVALLIYPSNDFQGGAYLPFAEFSPEWQALQYGFKQNIPIIPMDLSIGVQLPGYSRKNNNNGLRRDPLGYLAQLAGFGDSERWWDATMEQEDDDLAVFDMIEEMTAALREGSLFDEPPLNIAREAFMRQVLRNADKKGYQKIAVICGAWHGPALSRWQSITAASDRARLKGLKKEKYAVSWIPWNYERLAFSSGYGAGVVSPAWYELLFRYKTSISTRWMSKAGRLLRKEGQEASPANVVEAVRLSETLTALRNKPLPELSELEDAAVTVLCRGDHELFGLIRKKLVTGQKAGKVPQRLTTIPLQKDFEKRVKSAYLSKAYKSQEAVTKELDLRKDTQLLASKLLHSLLVLEVPWGKPMKGSQYKTGSFSEKWKLKWSPDYIVRIIQSAVYGNTIEEAALNKMKEKLDQAESLKELTELMDQSIKAGIPGIIAVLSRKIQRVAALTKDLLALLEALPTLVQVYKYGDQRNSELLFFKHLIEEIVPRIRVGLPGACSGIEEELAEEVLTKLAQAHHAVLLYQQKEMVDSWYATLKTMGSIPSVHVRIQGWAWRTLFDRGKIDMVTMERIISGNLVTLDPPMEFARWLEGFLDGSGLLLIHNPSFWTLLDEWITDIPEEQFKTILPVLRRSFALFQPPERQKMLEMARWGIPSISGEQEDAIDEEQAEPVLKVVRKLLES